MKEFFVSLCAFVIMSGILRGLTDDEKFSRYYGVISGILMLVLILSGARNISLPEMEVDASGMQTDDGGYERLVLAHAQARLGSAGAAIVYEKTGISCTVRVTLRYEEEQVSVVSVDVDGIRWDGVVAQVLGDYFSVKEREIHFNG